MSRIAKICFLIAFLVLVGVYSVKFVTGAWLNLFSVLIPLAAAVFLAGLAVDYKTYLEFFRMRTTKHGMNMGAMIVMVLVVLVCVNYLANLHNKSWDFTAEKLNSLSDQTTQVLGHLTDDVKVTVFTGGGNAADEKQKVKQTLQMLEDASGKIKVRYLNQYVDGAEAMTYLADLADRETSPTFVFVETKGKKIRVEHPYDEAAFTGALIKATREGQAKIYFVTGHGEKDIAQNGPTSLRELARALGEATIKTESLSLIDKKAVPDDASAVAVVGPSVGLLESEVQILRDYAARGGHLLIALDPGVRHNLAGLTKTLGVEFENNYVLSALQQAGAGPIFVSGSIYDAANPITKSIPSGTESYFLLASEVRPAPGKSEDITVDSLVKTGRFTYTVDDLRARPADKPELQPFVLGVAAKGHLPVGKAGKSEKEFEAVIFGDSDFLSDRIFLLGANKDLALNALAKLASQDDLISIRPKLPAGSVMILSGLAQLVMVGFVAFVPLVLLVFGGITWFRRRGA